MVQEQVLRSALGRVFDFLLPPRCYSCGAAVLHQGALCGDCWAALTFLTPPHCTICGYPFDYSQDDGVVCGACLARRPLFDMARSVLEYDDASRPLILAFKHGDRPELARPAADMMARLYRNTVPHSDLILPVPLHRRRLLSRRFNQAALLASELSMRLDVPWSPGVLKRVKRTRSQGGLSRQERSKNVRKAFQLEGDVKGKDILLVDDVLTTGATVEACTRLLKKHGAGHIYVLTLARVVMPGQSPI